MTWSFFAYKKEEIIRTEHFLGQENVGIFNIFNQIKILSVP